MFEFEGWREGCIPVVEGEIADSGDASPFDFGPDKIDGVTEDGGFDP